MLSKIKFCLVAVGLAAARLKMKQVADHVPLAWPASAMKEVVLAAHHGDTEQLRALLKANPILADSVRFCLQLK